MPAQVFQLVDKSDRAAHGDLGFGLFLLWLSALLCQFSISLCPMMVYGFVFTFTLVSVLKAICEVAD